LLPHEGTIVIPKEAGKADYEGELVAVMGKRAKNVSKEDALSYVLGYTCGNDVSVREWQDNDTQWWRAKSCDTFAPLGPWIVTGLDPSNLNLSLRLNGETKQQSSTSLLIYDLPAIISFASRHVTLEPGDVIYTGTPGQTSPMKAGDVVEVEVDGIGVLRNHVAVEQ
ncbi:MAG: fumarylacetoacetate hydrolase family protein, partial [Chloroflexi bacterium]|nr:fumarylacetoacetate hydrolase family protein [Chloroflexota bacterium]